MVGEGIVKLAKVEAKIKIKHSQKKQGGENEVKKLAKRIAVISEAMK